MCSSKEVRRLEQDDEEGKEDEVSVAYVFIGVVNTDEGATDFKFKTYIPELPKLLYFIMDTGVDIICVSEKCIPKRNREKLILLWELI